MSLPVIVSRRAGPDERRRADALAARWGLTRCARDDVDPATPALLVMKTGLGLRAQDRIWRWHDGLLHARLEAGTGHPLVRLTGMAPGDLVLDCTLGLGADARLCAAITGRRVLACEASLPVFLCAREGLARAAAPVEVLYDDAEHLVRALPARSVDIVVCDPMFPPGQQGTAPTLDVLRLVAVPWTPDRAWLDAARRIARKAVVVRDTASRALLRQLGTPDREYVRHGRIARYGVWLP